MATTVKNILLQVSGETKGAQRSVRELAQDMRDLPEGATVDIDVENAKALQSIRDLRARLREVDRERADPRVNVAVSKAFVDLETLELKLRALPSEQVIDVKVQGDALRDLQRVEAGVARVGASLARAAGPTRTFGDTLSNVGTFVKSITPALNGLQTLLAVKLAAGLLAVGASAAAAVAGVGALAAALAAAAGPAAVLLIGVVSRLTKVFEALKAQDDAADASSRKSAAGSAAAAQAAERRRSTEAQLADALRGATQAEANLISAREAAAEAIADANQTAADAARDLASAQRGMREAGTQAFRELQDAAEDASDAIRGVKSAQISLDEAKLSVEEAVLDLKEFRQEAGAAGSALDAAFRKFSDVDVEFDSGALREALGGAGVEDPRDQLELERRILAVRSAKQREKEATDELSDSERRRGRAIADNARLQRGGKGQTDTMIAAQDRLREATRRAGEAEEEAQRLRDLGVAKAPAVVAALEAQRDARDSVASARAARRTAIAPGTTDAEERARQKTGELTGAEQRFLETIKKVRKELNGFLTPALDSVFDAMDKAVGRAPALLNPLRGAFNDLGDAVGDTIDKLSGDLVSEDSVNRIKSFTEASGRLTRTLGGDALSHAGGIFGDIAEIAMPRLEEGATKVADQLEKWDSLGGSPRQVDTINKAVDSFEAWADGITAVIDLWGALIRTVAPEGNELVRWITKGVRQFTRWLNTAEGQEQVKQFFDDTIPSVKALLRVVWTLGKIFLRVLQFISPILEGAADALNWVLELFDGMLKVLNDIVSNPIGRWIRYMIGQFLGIRGIATLIGLAGTALSGIGGIIRTLGPRIGPWLWGPFSRAFTTIRGAASGLGGSIISRLQGGIRAASGRISATGGTVLRTFRDGVFRAWGVISGLGLRIGFAVVRGVVGAYNRVRALGGRVISWLREGFNAGARRILAIGAAVVSGLIAGLGGEDAIRKIANRVRKIVTTIIDVAKDLLGIKSPSRVFRSIGENVIAGFLAGSLGQRWQIISAMERLFGPDVWKQVASFIEKGVGLLDVIGAPDWMKELVGDPREWVWANTGERNLLHFGHRRLVPDDTRKMQYWQYKASEIASALTGRSAALIAAKLGLRGVGEISGDIRKRLITGIGDEGLAAGGLAVGPAMRLFGEAGKEAVLPLTRRVMAQLAGSITGQMSSLPLPAAAGRAPLAAAAGSGGAGGQTIHIDRVVLPGLPEGGVIDPRYAAVMFAQELSRRGASVAGGVT